MPRTLRYLQVDVFSDRPLRGNPLVVYPDARGLGDEEMQAIAREHNLSETTFVLPADIPGADYRVRIFSPGRELPFAGHPTLGTAHALLESGVVAGRGDRFTLRQQTLAGVQSIDGAPGERGLQLTMTLPPPELRAGPPVAELAAALGIEVARIVGAPATVSVGVAWHVVELDGLATVAALAPDMGALARLEERTGPGTTVFCEGAQDPACAIRVRSFAPGLGVPEDPVCGSGNGCVAAYRAHRDEIRSLQRYDAEQGVEMGRGGRAHVEIVPDDGSGLCLRVGGTSVTVARGELLLGD